MDHKRLEVILKAVQALKDPYSGDSRALQEEEGSSASVVSISESDSSAVEVDDGELSEDGSFTGVTPAADSASDDESVYLSAEDDLGRVAAAPSAVVGDDRSTTGEGPAAEVVSGVGGPEDEDLEDLLSAQFLAEMPDEPSAPPSEPIRRTLLCVRIPPRERPATPVPSAPPRSGFSLSNYMRARGMVNAADTRPASERILEYVDSDPMRGPASGS